MNKAEFIDAVAAKAGLSKKDAKGAVDAVLDTITEALVKKDSVRNAITNKIINIISILFLFLTDLETKTLKIFNNINKPIIPNSPNVCKNWLWKFI